jgi:hypothetical protein
MYRRKCCTPHPTAKKNSLAGPQWLTPIILATQEDRSSKPARANGSPDPISKIPNTQRANGVADGVGPEFKLRYLETTIIVIIKNVKSCSD